jgi:uncharacterized membrane protein YfcA
MTLSAMALIGATIVITSFISGVFGMAGGMILLAVLLVYLDVATAMIAISVIQFAANGWRALLWRQYARWDIIVRYIAGAAIAFAGMRFIAFVPNKAAVYIALGLLTFTVEILPTAWRPNIEWRGVPYVTGVLTTVVQVLSGIGGPFLDVFFQKSKLDRKTTVATKAVSQTFSHVGRVIYFSSLAGLGEAVPIWAFAPAILMAIVGTSLAPYVLHRMTDDGFRRWTRMVIFGLATISLARGLWLLAA